MDISDAEFNGYINSHDAVDKIDKRNVLINIYLVISSNLVILIYVYIYSFQWLQVLFTGTLLIRDLECMATPLKP